MDPEAVHVGNPDGAAPGGPPRSCLGFPPPGASVTRGPPGSHGAPPVLMVTDDRPKSPIPPRASAQARGAVLARPAHLEVEAPLPQHLLAAPPRYPKLLRAVQGPQLERLGLPGHRHLQGPGPAGSTCLARCSGSPHPERKTAARRPWELHFPEGPGKGRCYPCAHAPPPRKLRYPEGLGRRAPVRRRGLGRAGAEAGRAGPGLVVMRAAAPALVAAAATRGGGGGAA